MPHPDSEHGLRVQLAAALRERDEARAALADARDRLDAVDAQRIALEVALESERTALAAANARADAAEARWYNKVVDHCPHPVDDAVCCSECLAAALKALAAARRECEGLRTALSDLIQEMNFGGGCDGTDPSCDGCIAVAEARKALAAPAAAAGEEGT